jgi:hypothetical protein
MEQVVGFGAAEPGRMALVELSVVRLLGGACFAYTVAGWRSSRAGHCLLVVRLRGADDDLADAGVLVHRQDAWSGGA